MLPVSRTVISRPFRANPLTQCFPGLKPWAESYSPFGATNRAKILLNLAPFDTGTGTDTDNFFELRSSRSQKLGIAASLSVDPDAFQNPERK